MEDRGSSVATESSTQDISQGSAKAATSSSTKGTSIEQSNSSADLAKRGKEEDATKEVSTKGPQKMSHTVEDATKELNQLTRSQKISTSDILATSAILREHATLKEKVDKLKSLLGRSAKAQRETKVDLDAAQKRLNQALREIERLHQKLEKLQSRPTHLDLLMDFETNFDKALLSVGQSGGEDTAASPSNITPVEQDSALDSMLMQELGEAKTRIEKLETLNAAMMGRSTQLENSTRALQKERDEVRQQNDRLQLELRMAKMECDHATKEMHNKQASLDEMQLEIDLITKASAKANTRAAKGEKLANSQKSDRQKVQELEAQVQALREWATASSEAKRLMQERCSLLENKLKHSQGRHDEADDTSEKVLFQKAGSMVVGAGDKAAVIVELGKHAMDVDCRFVVLRWKFDSSPSDCTVEFNILKGKCETDVQKKNAEYIIKDRIITGGAGGESEGAFNSDNACTLLWSNERSWIRPRTVKYSLDIVSLK